MLDKIKEERGLKKPIEEINVDNYYSGSGPYHPFLNPHGAIKNNHNNFVAADEQHQFWAIFSTYF